MVDNLKDFKYYADCFSSLHTAVKLGKPAPHKALLLLSVIDLVERGVIVSPRIELSDSLVATFNVNARKYYAYSPIFKPEISQPFYHMGHESFWRLVSIQETAVSGLAAEPATGYGNKKASYSLKGLRENFRYALIDEELFDLLGNEDVRARLRVLLISKYLSNRLDLFSPVLPMSLLLLCNAGILQGIA